MLKRIEIISDELSKAIHDGLFNNIWFFIKDFSNYRLQFIVQDKNNENEQIENIIIGELNSFGFKDVDGNYNPLTFERCIDKSDTDKSIPPKYLAELVGDDYWFDDIVPNDAAETTDNQKTNEIQIIRAGIFSAHSFELLPFKYHIEKNDFTATLPIELLYKIEESITFELVNNIPLKEFLFKSLFLTFKAEFEFESYLSLVSYIKDDKGNAYLNTFFGLDIGNFFSIIKPAHHDILKEANKLTATTRISSKVQKLLTTFLDDLLEIEEKERSKIGFGLVFREYHRLIERLGNYIYENLYHQIQTVAESIPNELHYEYNLKQILSRKDLYRITNLNQFSKLLRLISSNYSNIIIGDVKKEVKEKYIPVIDTFSGFSSLRNIQTHDKISIEDDVLIAGINACKTVILNVYQLFNELLKNQE